MIYLAALRLIAIQHAVQVSGSAGPDAVLETADRFLAYMIADGYRLLGEDEEDYIGEPIGNA